MGSEATRLTKPLIGDLQSERRFSPFAVYGPSKHATQAFGFELDRRLRAAHSPVIALVRAKLLFLISGGKDVGAWPAVRAATDPDAVGGQYWGPRGHLSGPPLLQKPVASSSGPVFGAALWEASERFVGQPFAL